MTSGVPLESPAIARLLLGRGGLRGALHVLLELREAGPLGRVQHLATELDGHGGDRVVQAREQRYLDALERFGGLVQLLLEHAAQWADESVREQDAEERADERVRDQKTELRRREADRL